VKDFVDAAALPDDVKAIMRTTRGLELNGPRTGPRALAAYRFGGKGFVMLVAGWPAEKIVSVEWLVSAVAEISDPNIRAVIKEYVLSGEVTNSYDVRQMAKRMLKRQAKERRLQEAWQ
jgi:hypothetical protein